MKQIDESCYWKEITTGRNRVGSCFGGYSIFERAKTILDWGCSFAKTSKEILRNTKDNLIIGIDNSNRIPLYVFQGINQKYGDRLTIVQGDGFSYFQKKGKKFDIVLCMNNGLNVLNQNNREVIISYWDSLVRDKGELILASNYGDVVKDRKRKGAYVILEKSGRSKRPDGLSLKSLNEIKAKNELEREILFSYELVRNIERNLKYFEKNF